MSVRKEELRCEGIELGIYQLSSGRNVDFSIVHTVMMAMYGKSGESHAGEAEKGQTPLRISIH